MKIIKQGIFFLAVSGLGWVMDFCLYFIFVKVGLLSVFTANLISSLLASSFVFVFSARKIFSTVFKRVSIEYKMVLYAVYQVFLIMSVSILGQFLYNYWHLIFEFDTFFVQDLKIWLKVFITPVTFLCNFIAMKIVTEKI